MGKFSTTDEFITKAQFIHGDRYNYVMTKYVSAKEPVTIICREHGPFKQQPNHHLSGSGCPECAGRINSVESFVSEARKVHGWKYDYSKSDFVNMTTKITIVCHEHGEFEQTPHNHIKKRQGCPKCGGNKRKTTELFVTELKSLYGDLYDYSKVEYVNADTKVCVVCPTHGEIWRKPYEWMYGGGCPKCQRSGMEIMVGETLKLSGIEYKYQYKPTFLKDGRRQQSVDFYIPEINLAIECQGIQHFRPVEAFGGEDGFRITRARDFKKAEILKENGVRLAYFTTEEIGSGRDSIYTDINKLVRDIRNDKVICL